MSKASSEAANVVTAKTRLKISRKHGLMHSKHVARYTRHVGEVVHAWNTAHAACFALFRTLAAAGDHKLAIGIWHTIQSDLTQRQMLRAAAEAKLQTKRSYLSAVKWAVKALDDLSAYRNDAAHTEMHIVYDLKLPGLSVKPASRARLEKSPLEQHWKHLRGDLRVIAHYLHHVDLSLQLAMPRPLSRRPRLLIRLPDSQSKQARSRRAKAKARASQRQSSQL